MKNKATFTTTTRVDMSIEKMVEINVVFEQPIPMFDWPRYMASFINKLGASIYTENSAKCMPIGAQRSEQGQAVITGAKLAIWLLDCDVPEKGKFSVQDSPSLGRFTQTDLMRFFKYTSSLRRCLKPLEFESIAEGLKTLGCDSLMHLYSTVISSLAKNERYGDHVDALLVERTVALWPKLKGLPADAALAS
jgi:hypothetical protein